MSPSPTSNGEGYETIQCPSCERFLWWRCMTREMPPIPYSAWPRCAWEEGDGPDLDQHAWTEECLAPEDHEPGPECLAEKWPSDIDCCTNNANLDRVAERRAQFYARKREMEESRP